MRISNRLLLTIVLIFFTCSATAEELRASLAKMPVHALSKSEGIQVDLVNAIATVSGYDIDIDVYPFARSIDNVISGSADFHIPLIKNEVIPASELPYAYSTETIFQVNFVLYTKKGSEVNKENLANFSIETERAHVDYFPFKLSPSNSIEQSLKRLSLGMIDGYIFADTSTDPLLLKLGYNNISRSLYKVFDVKIVLSKNENGKRIDDILSKSIQTLKANGRLQRIEESVNFPYDNWQPGDL